MPERGVRKSKIEEEGGRDDTPIAAPKPKPVKQEEPKQEDYGDEDDAPIPPGAPKEKGGKAHKKKQKKEVGRSDSKPSKAKGEGTHDSKDLELKAYKEKRKKKSMKKRKRVEEKKVARKEKKAYDLPGQKHDTPEERDPLRIFYETLYQQLPDSEMAAVWMMEWGLLPLDEAKKVYKNKLKRNQQQKPGSPTVKVAAAVKKTSQVSVKRGNEIVIKSASKTKKRKVNDDTSDDNEDGSISAKKKIKKHSPSS